LPATGAAAAGNSTANDSPSSHGNGDFPLWAALLVLLFVVLVVVGVDQARRRRRRAVASAGNVASQEPPGNTLAPATSTAVPGPPHQEPFRFDALGPPRASGWKEEPDGELLRELAGFLAFQEQPVSLDEISRAVWPTGGAREAPSRESLHTYMSRLRKALGHDRLPDATAGRGYGITDAQTDWGIFRALCARAEGAEEAEAMALRRQALSLVRGVPFASAPKSQYGWALESGLVEQMTVAVVRCAHLLAEQCAASGDAEGARAAVEQGLLASPSEEQLLADLWRLATSAGDSSEQRRVRARIAALLGPEAAERICGA
jgi:DNA-binding SARP family transcriptional activator